MRHTWSADKDLFLWLHADQIKHNHTTSLYSTSGKSQTRTSLVISNPIPCNTAFPADHVSVRSSTLNGQDGAKTQSVSEDPSRAEEESVGSSKHVASSDSDLSLSGTNTPKRQSVCTSNPSTTSESPEEAEAELDTNQSDDSDKAVSTSDQEASAPCEAADSPVQDAVSGPPAEEAKSKPAPVPAPRISFHSANRGPVQSVEEMEPASADQDTSESADNSSAHNPPGAM